MFVNWQVMETKQMIYLVTEYASGGEIYGMYLSQSAIVRIYVLSQIDELLYCCFVHCVNLIADLTGMIFEG